MTAMLTLAQTLAFLQDSGVTEDIDHMPLGQRSLDLTQAFLKKLQPEALEAPKTSKRLVAVSAASHDTLHDQLKEVRTLAELRRLMEAFEGCALKQTAKHTVFADGNPEAPLMLVGEAPGAEEDLRGLPFVGLSGQLLDKMFQSIGFDRTSLYISNTIPWRPPGNRQPTTEETTLCLPFIEKHIALVKPKVLVFVGGVAAKTLLRSTEGVTKLRGRWLRYENPYLGEPLRAFCLFHPAYLLRSPGQKKYAWADLLELQKALQAVTTA